MSQNIARLKARAGSNVKVRQRGNGSNKNKVALRIPKGIKVRIKRV